MPLHGCRVLWKRIGYAVLHDRRPPYDRANVDRLMIGPSGISCVGSKRWDRRTQIHGRRGELFVGRRPATRVVRPRQAAGVATPAAACDRALPPYVAPEGS